MISATYLWPWCFDWNLNRACGYKNWYEKSFRLQPTQKIHTYTRLNCSSIILDAQN